MAYTSDRYIVFDTDFREYPDLFLLKHELRHIQTVDERDQARSVIYYPLSRVSPVISDYGYESWSFDEVEAYKAGGDPDISEDFARENLLVAKRAVEAIRETRAANSALNSSPDLSIKERIRLGEKYASIRVDNIKEDGFDLVYESHGGWFGLSFKFFDARRVLDKAVFDYAEQVLLTRIDQLDPSGNERRKLKMPDLNLLKRDCRALLLSK